MGGHGERTEGCDIDACISVAATSWLVSQCRFSAVQRGIRLFRGQEEGRPRLFSPTCSISAQPTSDSFPKILRRRPLTPSSQPAYLVPPILIRITYQKSQRPRSTPCSTLRIPPIKLRCTPAVQSDSQRPPGTADTGKRRPGEEICSDGIADKGGQLPEDQRCGRRRIHGRDGCCGRNGDFRGRWRAGREQVRRGEFPQFATWSSFAQAGYGGFLNGMDGSDRISGGDHQGGVLERISRSTRDTFEVRLWVLNLRSTVHGFNDDG